MSDSIKPKIYGVVGPTASGKTAYAIELAKKCGGEVISCDSMQIYRHMDIGTAKPTKYEMDGIPHHMIDIAEPWENYSVARFVTEARSCIDDVLARGRVPILCGGTGLYFDSVIKNIDFAENESAPEYRSELQKAAEEHGNEYVHNMLKKVDPKSAEAVHPNNLKRVIRALEIYKTTGKTKTELDRESVRESLYNAEIYGLNRPREELYERINKRVDIMLKNGLLDEVKNLLEMGISRDATSMQAIGYKELVEYFEGRCTLDAAIDKIKQESRRYAKRQLTWFKRNNEIIWLNM
ncbi:MAG: tRNA (adenosine(37)-N6)-dimethylallyltransferase MiaA [Clostridiales bacterium]|nr:tRNA (adenosine(37)-N6)-dimethylallyltransferase MiaA [Clostridiales bacterium]